MKPLVYIAGPYTNPDPVENTHRAIQIGMELYRTDRCAVIIPHLSLLTHLIMPLPVEFWYQFDLDQLAHCDAVFRFAGASTGADAEVAFALDRGIPVFHSWDGINEWLADREQAS